MILTERYNEPITIESPTGTNIQYDDDYQKLLVMLQEKPEQQFGDLIIEAQGPDWEEIHKISDEILLNKSKDLNVMSYFAQSGVACYGLKSLAKSLKIILENLSLYWEDIHPRLYDEDSEYDPDYRLNSLSLFNSMDGIIREVKNSFIIKNGISQTLFNVKEIENLLENTNVLHETYPGGLERLQVDMQIAAEQSDSAVSAVILSLEYLNKIKQLFLENMPEYELKFDYLEKLLLKFTRLTSGQEINAVESKNNHDEVSLEEINEIHKPLNWSNYPISTRQDIDFLLEKMYLYFERHEPSHPAPLFIRRIQKLMNFNFYEIMKDISPDSLGNLETLVGQPFEQHIDD